MNEKLVKIIPIIHKIMNTIKKHPKISKGILAALIIVYGELPLVLQLQNKFKYDTIELYLSPGFLIKNLFTKTVFRGLIRFNIVVAIVIAVILLFIITKKISDGEEVDMTSLSSILSGKPKEKKIVYSKSVGTYGTAEWMDMKYLTSPKMKQFLQVSDPKHSHGTILGYVRGTKKVITLPQKTFYNRNVLVLGSSGSMKTRSYVTPNILNLMRDGESMFITDPKGELVRSTSSILKKYGYVVKVLNLVNIECSDRWNLLNNVTDDISAIVFSKTIIDNTTDSKKGGDQFWDKGQQNLLKALALYIVNEMDDSEKNMTKLYQLITQKKATENLTALFNKLPADHPAMQPFNIFLESADNDKVRAGMISGLATRLQLFQARKFKMLTEGDDIDLELPGKKKCAYFLVIPDSHSSFDFMAALFYSFAFMKLTNEADLRLSGKLKLQVNFILDEFSNICQIPDFTKKISTIRSRGINVFVIIQNITQLENRYPDGAWEEIISGCDNKVFLGCNENTTADYIEKTLGTSTVEDTSESNDKYSMTSFKAKESKRYVKRNLMNADEVLKIDPFYSIIIPKGQNPIKAEKMDFTEHPLYPEMEDTPVKTTLKEWSAEFHEEWLELHKNDDENENNLLADKKNEDTNNDNEEEITEDTSPVIEETPSEKGTKDNIDSDTTQNKEEKLTEQEEITEETEVTMDAPKKSLLDDFIREPENNYGQDNQENEKENPSKDDENKSTKDAIIKENKEIREQSTIKVRPKKHTKRTFIPAGQQSFFDMK